MIHCSAVGEAPSERWIVGAATLTTIPSRRSMHSTASTTARISQRLGLGADREPWCVMKDLIKAIEGEQPCPVLVLSGKKTCDIADGFHRVSLVYRIDPYADIPLKLA
jgi:hypothetical protein